MRLGLGLGLGLGMGLGMGLGLGLGSGLGLKVLGGATLELAPAAVGELGSTHSSSAPATPKTIGS